MTLKNRGRSKKTEGRTRPKSKGGSLAVGTYLQRGSAPPPGHQLRLAEVCSKVLSVKNAWKSVKTALLLSNVIDADHQNSCLFTNKGHHLNPFTAKYPSMELILTKILAKKEKVV